MSEVSPDLGPLYAAAPAMSLHHGQIWVGTPPEFFSERDAHFDFRTDDVWLISFPRSGTAWSCEVIYSVLYGGDMAALEAAQRDGRVPRFLPLEIGIGAAASLPERMTRWKSLASPRVVPTHVPNRLFPNAALARKCKLIYVLRDPRDVAVSMYYLHRSHKLLGSYTGPWAEFFEHFINGRVAYGSWFDHTLGWWSYARANPDHVLVLTYERMKEDFPKCARQLAAFLGVVLSDQAVAAIAEHTSFSNMSTNPFTNRAGNPWMDFSIAPFMRKGVVGDWTQHFTPEQGERIQALWNQKMRGAALGMHLSL